MSVRGRVLSLPAALKIPFRNPSMLLSFQVLDDVLFRRGGGRTQRYPEMRPGEGGAAGRLRTCGRHGGVHACVDYIP